MINANQQFQGLNITFNTGESCNLACKYCYEVGKRQTVLSLDYAKRFIDIILADPDPIGVKGTKDEWILDQGLILDFIGGDALMHPKLVENILKYFIQKSNNMKHKWRHNWRGSIATNGTLFENKEVRDFVEKWHDVLSIGISIDGCPAIHDANRIYPDGRGSIETIKKWLPWYRQFYDGSTKSTLSKNSIPYLFESLKYMHEELQLNYINQNFIFEDMHLEQSDLDKLDEQMELCVNYVLKCDDLYWSLIDRRYADAISYVDNIVKNQNCTWCGSGAMPALSPDGKIYPCFRFLPHTQEKHIDMSVGDIWNEFDKKENFTCIRTKSREVISPDKCKSCDVESACAWCIAGSYSEIGKEGRQTYICETTKIQTKWAKIYWRKYDKN